METGYRHTQLNSGFHGIVSHEHYAASKMSSLNSNHQFTSITILQYKKQSHTLAWYTQSPIIREQSSTRSRTRLARDGIEGHCCRIELERMRRQYSADRRRTATRQAHQAFSTIFPQAYFWRRCILFLVLFWPVTTQHNDALKVSVVGRLTCNMV